ncbi:MAG: calcium-binding protein [Nitrospira sp.]
MALINGTAGNDVLNGTLGSDEVNGLAGDDKLFGNRGSDLLYGGAGKDTLRGDVGDDLLDGGTEADDMNGGDGNDTYLVDNVGDVAKESYDDFEAGFLDGVQSSVTHTLGFGIENLTLTGAAAINGTGNASGNNIDGNEANNVLKGGGGSDIINGSSGNDHLYGEAGFDFLSGGDGNDRLDGGAEDDFLFGDWGNDQLYGGAGFDSLYGGDGDDRLDGGSGADFMSGEWGNDTYVVDDLGDSVSEFFDGGVDTVKASVTHSLGFEVENLVLTGYAAINGTGNEKNNVITGNGAKNVLDGGDGNDQLIGGAGADALTGGLGTDTFKYKSASDSPAGSGKDVIIDFDGRGTLVGDRVDLSAIDANVSVTGNQAFKWIGSDAFTAAGQLRYSGGVLSGSIDGDSAAEFQIHLLGGPTLFVQAGHSGSDILL